MRETRGREGQAVMPEAPSLLRAVPRGGSAILGVTSRPSPAPWDPRCQLPEQSECQSADFSELKTLFYILAFGAASLH